TAWRRETMASGSTRSLDGSRPIVRIVVRVSGISRLFDDVGLTISFATRSASHEGLAEIRLHLDLHAALGGRLVLPALDRGHHDVVHQLADRLDHRHLPDLARLGDDEADEQ